MFAELKPTLLESTVPRGRVSRGISGRPAGQRMTRGGGPFKAPLASPIS